MAYDFVISTTTPHQRTILQTVKTVAESAGWTTVANEHSDGTYTRWVFRNPSSTFFAVFWYNNSGVQGASSSSNGLYATVCEDYDATAHTLTRPAVYSSNVICATSSTAASPSGSTAAAVSAMSLASVISTYGVIGIGAGSASWGSGRTAYISAFDDAIIVATNPSSSVAGILYVGEFSSLVTNASTNDDKPFTAAAIDTANNYNSGSTASLIGTTRSPLNNGKASHNWRHQPSDFSPYVSAGNPGLAGADDTWQGGPLFSPIIFARANRTTDGYIFGGVRGTLPRILRSGNPSVYGDTFVIDSATYICGSTSGYWFQKG